MTILLSVIVSCANNITLAGDKMEWWVIVLIAICCVAAAFVIARYFHIDMSAIAAIFGGGESLNDNVCQCPSGLGKCGGAPRRKSTIKDLVEFPRSKSEARAIEILEELTGEKFPTVVPSWLGLELDGYNADLKLALEFSGPYHTKWYPAMEPYEKYYERLRNDIRKRQKCKEMGVDLIVLDMSVGPHNYRNYIASRLYDMGRAEKPAQYIEEQKIIPYRNPHIERELGLPELNDS